MHLSLSPLLIRGKGLTILKTNSRQKSKQTNIFSEPKITSKRIDKYEWSLELCSAPIMTGFQNCNNCAKAIKYRNGMIIGWYLDDSLWIHNKKKGMQNYVFLFYLIFLLKHQFSTSVNNQKTNKQRNLNLLITSIAFTLKQEIW